MSSTAWRVFPAFLLTVLGGEDPAFLDTHSFIQQTLCVYYYVPETLLSAEDMAVNKTDKEKSPLSWSLCSRVLTHIFQAEMGAPLFQGAQPERQIPHSSGGWFKEENVSHIEPVMRPLLE